MGNVNNLATTFAKIIKEDATATKDSTVYGTAVEFNGKMYVKLDGSERMTPIETTASIKEGDRVTVLIKAHSATVTGNVTDPSTSTSDKKATDDKVKDLSSQVSEFGTVIAGKVSTEQLQAAEGRITNLESDNVNVKNELKAHSLSITNMDTKKASVDDLKATNAAIDNLKNNMLTTDTLDAKYATIKNLEATDATIHNLSVDYGTFKQVTADDLKARKAEIDDLSTNKLDASDAEIKYANIDFSNIGVAAIKQFYATSGIIKDLVIADQTVTGEIVGVTIKGDLIEGNTIVADKLVMKGDDGLFYKLNISAANGVNAEQTSYNSINGSIITAKSITATQISVKDLVAFDATIAGFKIKDTAIYSTGKESATSTVRGIYLGKDGQVGFGDGNNYIKFYIDADGKYKLGISAESLTFATGQSVKDAIDEVDSKVDAIKSIDSTTIGYLVGDSGTTPPTGIWSAGVPVVPNGKYLWCQKITTYTDGSHDYEYSVSRTGDKGEQGIPGLQGIQGEKGDQGIQGPKGDIGATGPQGKQGIQGVKGDTGATGPTGPQGKQGIQGPQGVKGTDGKNGTSSYFHVAYANSADGKTSFSVSDPSNRAYIGTYVDTNPTDSTDPTKYTWQLVKGAQGAKGDQGIKGTDGTNGKTSYLHIAYANSADGKTGFDVSNSSGKLYIGQYTDFMPGDSTNPAAYSWTKIKGEQGIQGVKGDTGATGPQGAQGKQGVQGIQGPQGKQGVQGPTGAAGKNATFITVSGCNNDTSGISSNTSYININGTKFGFNPGRGHTLVTVLPASGGVESIKTYDTYGTPTALDSALTSVSAGRIVCLFSADATALTQTARNALITCGSSMTNTWGASRTTHVFIGMKGLAKGNAYEAVATGSSGIRTVTAYYTSSGIVLNGQVGATGAKGDKGDKGNTGATGPTGPQGPQGKQGNTGATGPQGPQGKQGIQGNTGATGPQGAKGDGLDVKDTRSTNQPPSWYFANYPRTSVAEFKQCSVIGLSGNGNFCYLLTVVPWNDASGGYPKQTAKVEGTGKEYWRVGTSASAWSNWIECVQKGDVVNQVNSELKISGNSIALTTGHFTISSKNFLLDSAGNATFSGTVKAATIEGGTISGATIKGANGEFTAGFKVDINSNNNHSLISADGMITQISYKINNSDEYIVNVSSAGTYMGIWDNSGKTLGRIGIDSNDYFVYADGNNLTLNKTQLTMNGTIKASRFISNVKNIAVRMYGGSKVCNTGDNACNFLNTSEINSYLGISNSSNANTAVFASNGDGKAQASHLEGCTYVGGNWYATFSARATGSYRINYLVVYFG